MYIYIYILILVAGEFSQDCLKSYSQRQARPPIVIFYESHGISRRLTMYLDLRSKVLVDERDQPCGLLECE